MYGRARRGRRRYALLGAPVRRASTAIELIARMSCTRSTTRPGRLYEWKKSMSPIEPSVIAGQKIGMRLRFAQ